MVANKYAFLQITRRRFLNEWEAFKKVISRRNSRRRITIPLTLSNLKLLRRIPRTENILHRNFTRRQVAIQNRVASNIGISQSTFSVKVLNLFSRSRRKTNKSKSKHSAMLRNIFFLNDTSTTEIYTLSLLALFRSPPARTTHPRTWGSSVSVIWPGCARRRSEEHTSELQSQSHLVCRLLLALYTLCGKRTSAKLNILPCSRTKKRGTE